MKKFLRVMVISVLLMSMLIVPANAQSGVSVTYAGQVVDSITVNGVTVNAIYAPYTSISNYGGNTTYSCAAFVKKFYSNVYHVTVYNLLRNGGGPRISGGSGSFSRTTTPQVGDIVHYLTNSTTHWTIVKSVNGNQITVIEQNGWNNTARTQARIGKTYTVGSSGVTVYHYSNAISTPPVSDTTPPAPSPYTAYANYDTGSRHVSINREPMANTQIGRIPHGAAVTVYPDKSSGNWLWVEYNGVSGYSHKNYITTTQPGASNTRTGVVHGTNGALAINSVPAAGNQIGRIPEGQTCTVYPDKTSGNWYWVSYGGVSGYSYSRYITLQ